MSTYSLISSPVNPPLQLPVTSRERRTVDPTDKRATLISLTELGETRTAELQDEKNEKLDKAFGNLTDEEKEQLIALLEKLTAEK